MKLYIKGLFTGGILVSSIFLFMGTADTSEEYIAKRFHQIELKIDQISKDTENTNYWIQEMELNGVKVKDSHLLCK